MMDTTYRKLLEYLQKNFPDSGESLTEGIYRHYIEEHVIDSEKIRSCFRKIDEYTGHLPFDAQDDICNTLIAMCTEQERVAFIAGFHYGAQLMLELVGKN